MENILSSALKGNIYLEKGILTGILDTLDKHSSSGLNNIKIYNISYKTFSKSYGFSKKQIIQQLISKMFITKNLQVKKGIKKLSTKITRWYNGYTVYEGNNNKIKIFNPYNVT